MNAREASRSNWNAGTSVEAINAGSLQRIADATELMAKRHTELIAERDRFERYYRSEQACSQRLARQLSAAKGMQTKLKRQIDRLGEQIADKDAAAGSAAYRENAILLALGFAKTCDQGADTFLTLWERGDWDGIDARFSGWASYCQAVQHDYRQKWS